MTVYELLTTMRNPICRIHLYQDDGKALGRYEYVFSSCLPLSNSWAFFESKGGMPDEYSTRCVTGHRLCVGPEGCKDSIDIWIK